MIATPEPATPEPQAIHSQISPWLYWSLFPVHRGFVYAYFREIDIQGQEHLPAIGPVVLAVKHFSRWDPMVLALLDREAMRYMTNANQFGGIQGWFIQRLGAFPVDLARPQLASLRHTVKLLQSGQRLVLFPEGGIVRDRPLRDLKPGLARLLLQAESTSPEPLQIPILPVALRYTPAAVFRARVQIRVGAPLLSKDFQQENEKQTALALTQGLQAAMLAELAKLGVTPELYQTA